MLKCEFDNPKIFKNLFKGLSCRFSDVQIKFNSKGMILSVLDISHVVLANLNIEKDFFNEYYCEEEILLNIDIGEISKSLNKIYKEDILVIRANKEELSFIFQGELKRTFKINSEDEEFKPVNMPEIKPDRERCEVPSKLLIDMIKEVDKFDDVVKLDLDSDYFRLSNYNKEFRQFSAEYIHGEKIEGEHSSYFATEFIKDCLKSNISDIVGLKIGNTAPLSILFHIENLFLEFIIAPRIMEG